MGRALRERGFYMKKLLKIAVAIVYFGMVLWEIIGFLALPALFVIVGLLNSYPWQYYAFAVGGYLALFLLAEGIAYLLFRAFDKKYTPLLTRKLEKLFDRFSKQD